MQNDILDQYRALRYEIDEAANRLAAMHKHHLKCKKGCDSCCESLTIFPVEFFSIQHELADSAGLPKNKMFSKLTKSCRFLQNGACSIYTVRPIICRTQGLPLLYENADGNGFQLSACKLNFKGVNVATFNTDNALYMAPLNSRLFLLNRDFIQHSQPKFKPMQRLSLNSIFDLR